MAGKKAKGPQLDTITRQIAVPQISFNLPAQDAFVTSHGVQFQHWKAIPSPLGKKERGDYRKTDLFDDQESNGYLYKKHKCFTAVMLNNSKERKQMDGGVMDTASARITLPRFYDLAERGDAKGDRIYIAPGDRLYIADPSVDTRVANFQEMTFDPDRDNVAQFPIHEVEYLVDSRGVEHHFDVDFKITSEGSIRWLAGKGPGVDPETGKGRVYAVRYIYHAHWYVVALPNEVRIGNVTEGGVRKEERMPYQAQIVREYVYYNRQNSNKAKDYKDPKEDKKRTHPEPHFDALPGAPAVKVSMTDIAEDDDE
jgi:hypothetical protein